MSTARRRSTSGRRSSCITLLGLVAFTGSLHAQQTYEACYVPSVGAIYLIKQAGLPTACLAASHVAVSWTEGGGEPADGSITAVKLADGAVVTLKLADGAVTEPKLGFDPGTQAELDTHAASGDHDGRYFTEAELNGAGTINAAGNPVDWTRLKNVPAGLADGVDDVGAADHGALTGLADDDHAQYLLADGVRSATNGFAVTGTGNTGTIPATGAGVRLMWYPGKAAFRAGEVFGTEWDETSIGDHSAAIGRGTTASGYASTAMGSGAAASGSFATARGQHATASGFSSTAIGDQTTASGVYSTAMGSYTTAQAFGSTVIGRYNVVTGSQNSWVGTDPLLVAGNGTSGARSDALTLYKNGNLTIAGTLTESSDIRLKEDIEPVPHALDGVLGLTPIRYRFRAGTFHPTERQIGLSAQEVERVFPELVTRDSQGYLSVAYTDLTAVLVRAVQEQQETIEALRERIEQLEAVLAGQR